MLATLAFTLLVVRPKAAPAMSPQMASQLSLAAQQYGPPPAPVRSLSAATGLYMAPTDDVWVYANATNPERDEFLRAWGSNGRAMPLPGDDPQAYSWSLLKWDLSGLPDKARIIEAYLVLTQAPDAGYTAKDVADAPLEARPVKSDFSEANWNYADAVKYTPIGAEGDVFGETAPTTVSSTQFPIVIDLLKGPNDFKAYVNNALKTKNKMVAVAITSRVDPSKLGKEGIYKVYSKDATDPTTRPALRLVLDTTPETKKRRK